jgi:beta-lactam-binding protein with PASTA domain
MRVLQRKQPAWPAPGREEVTEVIEEGHGPPPPPPGRPPWDDLAPWLLLLLVLVLGGIAAAYFLTRDDNGKRAAPATTVVTTVAAAPATTAPATTAPATTAPATTAARARVARGVAVPYVVGQPAAAAVKRLTAAGLRPQVKGVFATKPKGTVVSEQPATGARVKKGSLVTLDVSKGKPLTPVPDVVGQTSKQALQLLHAAGFGGRVVEVPSSEPAGNVVAQSPKAGTKAAKSTVVRLNVATAPATTAAATTAPATTAPARTAPAATAPATTAPAATAPATTAARPTKPAPTPVAVPDLVGRTLAQARTEIRAKGLVTEVRYVPNSQPQGTVVAQSPKPGTTAKRADHVLVNVSQGPKPKQSTTVPDVVGTSEAAARQQLTSAGFTVFAQDAPANDPSQDGTVVDEQPAGGSAAPHGSEITIYVGRASG